MDSVPPSIITWRICIITILTIVLLKAFFVSMVSYCFVSVSETDDPYRFFQLAIFGVRSPLPLSPPPTTLTSAVQCSAA